MRNSSGPIAVVLVLIALAVGGWFYISHTQAPVDQATEQASGSITGPDSSNPYQSVNGVAEYFYSKPFNNASTTLCAFKSPNSTSTLQFASIQITTATTSAILIDIGKSTGTAFDATTTLLANSYRVAGGAQATVIASTSPAAGDAIVLAPNSNIVFKYGGTLGSLNALKGLCKASAFVN